MRAKSAMGLATPDLAQREVHMRFLRQSLVGVFLLAITLALLVGAVYLITGIGLFGQSRFALFFAVIACATSATLAIGGSTLAAMPSLQQASVLADGLTVLLCTLVLWQLHRQPAA